jgi:hypothetical protein
MRFPKLSFNKRIVALVTIFAILASVVFTDWFVKKTHPKHAPTPALAVTTAPAHVDTAAQPQVQFHYSIQPGDRMWFIAKASCGNALRANEMATANQIPSPDWIVAGKDVLTVLPQGCAATFTPKRAVMANHARSAIADSETDSQDEPPATIPAVLPTPTSTFATQLHAPTYYAYALPNPFIGSARPNQAIANNDGNGITASEEATADSVQTENPVQLPTANVPASKGYLWYVVHLAPANGRPMPTAGIWQALVVKNQSSKKQAKDRLEYRTGIVAVSNGDGAEVFVQLKHAPTEKDALVFLDRSGQRFRLRGQYLVANGKTTEFAPAALPRIAPADYAAIEKAFPVSKNGFRKILAIGAPLAINTALGFAAGGPVGVAISDGIYATTAIIHHQRVVAAERFAETQQQ